ncbi:MAG TPA: hypothetical protein VF588_18985 [Pyrinomonadaceae bacterium]|jgi:hypothetical protein
MGTLINGGTADEEAELEKKIDSVRGIVTFYTSLVIACVLGLALFKSADRLGIEID